MSRRIFAWLALIMAASMLPRVEAAPASAAHWFTLFKASATPQQLHQFLYSMPKGGDLHLHLGGSVFSEWYYELALAEVKNGYRYYTKQRINNCDGAAEMHRGVPYLLMHHTIDHLSLAELDDCERGEYVALEDLSPLQKTRWLNSIRLDQAHEGRDEFFERHWQRLGDLSRNPYLVAEALVLNMQAFAAEGLLYMEPQVPIFGFVTASGEALTPDQVMDIYRARLQQADALATQMTVRMQVSLLRFLPDAEAYLVELYRFAHRHPEVVAVNMVGREDNDKGYPLRFLETLRQLRSTLGGVNLSIHAGEVDEPNYHVRDTLLLGAQRIGHGVNLISDPETLLQMRYGPYLVEINLISNLLLEYFDDHAQHPFPEYLRIGVPVALSTDDRGMWDSTMTDEFFVAVKQYDLSWAEIEQLGRNSLAYSFLEEPLKSDLLERYAQRLVRFAQDFQRRGERALASQTAPRRGFICRQYEVCP